MSIRPEIFLLSPTIAAAWAQFAAPLEGQPGFRAEFMPGGRVPGAGEIVVNEPLARSLELIARTQGEAFYRGVRFTPLFQVS